MKSLTWFLSLFILLILQAGVLMPLHLAPVNLILIMIVAAALLADFNLGLGVTFVGGLLLDFVSGTTDGLVATSLLGVFLLLYFILNTILAREPNQIISFSSVAASTLVYFMFFLAFNQILGIFHWSVNLDVKYLFTIELPLTLLFNLLLTYPVFQYYLWVQKLTSKFGHHGQPIRS